MKNSLRLSALLLAVFTTFALHAGEPAKASEPADPKTIPTTEQRAAYPLKTCLVTDDDLDEMGHPVSYTYKEAGKPDRVVLFCCKDCVADFEKDPATYLKKLDAAQAKAGQAKKP